MLTELCDRGLRSDAIKGARNPAKKNYIGDVNSRFTAVPGSKTRESNRWKVKSCGEVTHSVGYVG